MLIKTSTFKRALDLLIPLRCLNCGSLLDQQEGLCPQCWPKIPFISKPYCACCGLPFEFEIEEGALCGACNASPPILKTARSLFAYTDTSKSLILKFKHADCTRASKVFGKWMADSAPLLESPLCVPVPLHWTRLFHRTYNQAALLAQTLAKIKKWPYAPTLLYRHRRTPSQGHFTKAQRDKNVQGGFKVSPQRKSQLQGRVVLLVDDVYTTGATLKACAQTLLKNGALEVHALTLARAVKTLAF